MSLASGLYTLLTGQMIHNRILLKVCWDIFTCGIRKSSAIMFWVFSKLIPNRMLLFVTLCWDDLVSKNGMFDNCCHLTFRLGSSQRQGGLMPTTLMDFEHMSSMGFKVFKTFAVVTVLCVNTGYISYATACCFTAHTMILQLILWRY